MAAHGVVDTTAGQNHLGMVADFLGFVREVVGVNANAMAADQSRAEWKEIPLCACSFENLKSIQPKLVKDKAQFIHECDIHIALGVLDNLCGFGDLDAAGLVGSGFNNFAVKSIDDTGDFGRGAGGYFFDRGEAVLFVPGIDALGTVADKKILIELEARNFLEHGHAVFLGATGIDGALIDHNVSGLEDAAHGLASFDQRSEVRTEVFIDGRGNGDDVGRAILEVLAIA